MKLRQALLHNTGWKILAMLFTFVNNIIIVRMTGAETSASFFYAIAVFTLLGTFLRFGLENGITYFSSKFPARTGPLILFAAGVSIVQVIIAVVILKYFIGETAGYSLFWTTVFVCGNVMLYYVTAFYQVKRMYISINFLSALIVLVQTAVLSVFYFSGTTLILTPAGNVKDSLLMILSAGLLLQLILLWAWFYFSNKKDFSLKKAEAPHLKELFSYSLINFGASVLLYLVMRADFYFVEKYCDAKTLGNYVQVAKIGQMALLLPSMLGGVIFPYSVNADETFTGKINFICRILTLFFLAGMIGLFIFGKYIFVHLLGPDFDLVHTGILAAFPGVFCLAMNILFTSYFEGQNRQWRVLGSTLISLVIILVCDRVFVPQYGYMAAACVFSVANAAGMLILLAGYMKKSGSSFKEIFIFSGSDVKVLKKQ